MRKLMKKQNGFTLIEMLIVVAIVAILVAISIPLINGSLENAREATDAANERAAKAEILLTYMTGSQVDGVDFVVGETYYYDAENGRIVKDATNLKAYGKGTTAGAVSEDHTADNMFIWVSLDASETVSIGWIQVV